MRYYAHVVQGLVAEIIKVDDDEPPLNARYPVDFVRDCVEMDGSQKYSVRSGWRYDGSAFHSPAPFIAPPPATQYVSVATVRERMEEAGTWDALSEILQSKPALMIKVLTLRDGIAENDQQARDLIRAAGSDPDEILKV